MRLVILVVAALLCLASAKSADGRYRQRSALCGNNPNCQQQASTRYIVESQREMIQDQNNQAAMNATIEQNAAIGRRCDGVVGALMQCEILEPSGARAAREHCLWSIGPQGTERAYGQTLCFEQSTTCDHMKWCLSH